MRRSTRHYGLLIAFGFFLSGVSAANEISDSRPSTHPDEAVIALHTHTINARDLKTLHYMENAHGQLEQWSARLVSRLEHGMGPRESDPILDGRADLQIQKIAITYASYTHTDALSQTLRHLAKAHRQRLTALQEMTVSGADRAQFEALSKSVTTLINDIRDWSKQR